MKNEEKSLQDKKVEVDARRDQLQQMKERLGLINPNRREKRSQTAENIKKHLADNKLGNIIIKNNDIHRK